MPATIRFRSRHALYALIVQMAGVCAGYLMHVALARWMGPADYGSYSYAMAWVGLLAMAAALGLPVGSVRFIAQYRANGQFALLRGTVRRFRQLVLIAGSTVALLATIAALTFGGFPRWIIVAAWLVPLSSFANLNTEMARGMERPGISQVPDKVLRPLAMIAASSSFYAAAGGLSIQHAMLAGLSASLCVTLLQLWLLTRTIPQTGDDRSPEYRTGEWMQVASSLLAVSFFVLLLNQMDVLVAGLILEPKQIGLYSAALRVATLIGFVPLSVTIVASPQIAALHSRNDTGGLQELATRIAHLSFWPSLLLAAGLMLLASPILRLFGPEFAAARWSLCILAGCQLFKSAMGAVGYFLDMTGHQAYNARAFAVASAVSLLLNVIAIPRFGIAGAAGANLLSWALVTLWLHREVARHVGVRASIVSALRLQREPRVAFR